MRLKVTVNGTPYSIDVEVEEPEREPLGAIMFAGGPAQQAKTTASVQATSTNAVTAPLSGSVSRILVEEGQEIKQGEVLLVLEAMKMETEITAPQAGKVARILVAKGDAVTGGEALIDLD